MHKVIYMTGAPASGKSSTARLLADRAPNLEVFEYGARLVELIRKKRGTSLVQEDLRTHSSLIVTKEDVDALDAHLIEYAAAVRSQKHLLIDSHPVTKERYGFRVTAFSPEFVKKLSLSEIWVLFASADETIRRIKAEPGGRPVPTLFDANFHTELQASVAATYGILMRNLGESGRRFWRNPATHSD